MYAVEIEKNVNNRFIEIPDYEKFKSKLIKVIFMVVEDKLPNNQKYNFDDLIGKLEWKGDAVSVQRELRNEW